MARAEWGADAEEMDEVELGWMLRSYFRRQRFQAELLANTVVNALAVAMGGAGAQAPASPSPHQARPRPQSQVAPAAATATPQRQVVPAYEFFKILES